MKQKNSLIDIFKQSIKLSPAYIIISSILVIVSGLLQPINTIVFKNFLDEIIKVVSNNIVLSTIIFNLIIVVAIQIYQRFNFIPTYFIDTKFGYKVNRYYSEIIINKISKLEYKYIEDSKTYDLIHRIKSGVEEKVTSTIGNLQTILAGFIGIIGVLAILAQAGWWISLITLVIIVISAVLSYKCSNRKFKATVEYSQVERESNYFEGLFRDRVVAQEVKLFRAGEYIKNLFSNSFGKVIKNLFTMEYKNRMNTEVVLRIIGYTLPFSVYIILLFPLYDQSISIGFYVALIAAVNQSMNFITTILPTCLQSLFETRLFWKEYNTFLGLDEKLYDKKDNCISQIFNKIEFKNVYFKYPGTDHNVLNNLNLIFEAGNQYAIVGENGAGKSTIIKLLLGLYQVDKGEILIDGVNINDLGVVQLSEIFSVIFQDYAKYFISVKDNILLANQIDVTTNRNDEFVNIAHQIGMENFINKLPNGYDTILGQIDENGADISGGEWQKIALCRALISNAFVRIMDEPTSSLDPEAEFEVYRLFSEFISDKFMTILISHRLGSTKLVNKIILIENGEVKEMGTHNELMEKKSSYYEMFNIQKKWYA